MNQYKERKQASKQAKKERRKERQKDRKKDRKKERTKERKKEGKKEPPSSRLFIVIKIAYFLHPTFCVLPKCTTFATSVPWWVPF